MWYDIAQTFVLAFFGTVARFLMHRKLFTGDLVAFPILITLLMLLFSTKLEGFNRETMWGISGIAGFTLPTFKNWLGNTTIAKLIHAYFTGAKSGADSMLEKLGEELEKNED